MIKSKLLIRIQTLTTNIFLSLPSFSVLPKQSTIKDQLHHRVPGASNQASEWTRRQKNRARKFPVSFRAEEKDEWLTDTETRYHFVDTAMPVQGFGCKIQNWGMWYAWEYTLINDCRVNDIGWRRLYLWLNEVRIEYVYSKRKQVVKSDKQLRTGFTPFSREVVHWF